MSHPSHRPSAARSGEGPGWLVSFADLLSILLVFMVLLFSMNAVPQDKWESLLSAMQATEDPSQAALRQPKRQVLEPDRIVQPRAINLSYLGAVLEHKFTGDKIFAGASIGRRAGRMLLTVPTESLFLPGTAYLKQEARGTLLDLADNFALIGNGIAVAAHTSPAPPVDPAYRDNFELSLQRAVAIAEILKQSGYSRDIVAYGLADTRFGDLDPALGPDARYDAADRVEIEISAFSAGEEPWL